MVSRYLNWGVSDHHKFSSEPRIFWKHQCALMDHNIFMKQIGSILVIQNHSDIFFWMTNLYFCGFFRFSCLKSLFLNLHQEKLSCNADIKMPYCIQLPLLTKPTKFLYKMSCRELNFFLHIFRQICPVFRHMY